MSARIDLAEYRSMAKKKPRRANKYKAKKTPRCLSCGSAAVYSGRCASCGSDDVRRFDSLAEARYYDELRLRQEAGEISILRCQVPFPIEVNGITVGKFLADFTYHLGGKLVVVDVKGGSATDTPLSRFKRKCVEAQYGIRVEVVRR